MRKLLIAIMAALMLALPLSASISSDPAFLRVRGLEMPVSARMAGMGMAGISSVKGYDALNYNPAALADSGFTLTLPYVNVTLYNTASMLTSGIIDAALALPGATEENQQELADALMDSADIFAQSLGTYNKVANIEAGVGFTAGGFGFNFYIIDSVHSYNAGAGSLASLSLINRLNAAISIGYGHRISFPYGYSLDIGAAVRFSYLAVLWLGSPHRYRGEGQRPARLLHDGGPEEHQRLLLYEPGADIVLGRRPLRLRQYRDGLYADVARRGSLLDI